MEQDGRSGGGSVQGGLLGEDKCLILKVQKEIKEERGNEKVISMREMDLARATVGDS